MATETSGTAKRVYIPPTRPGYVGFDVNYQVSTSRNNHRVAIEEGDYKPGAIVAMNRGGQEYEIAEIKKNYQIKFVDGGLCWSHDCKVIRQAQQPME